MTLGTTRVSVTSVTITVGGAGSIVIHVSGGSALGAGSAVYYGISETASGSPNNVEQLVSRTDAGTSTYLYAALSTSYMDTVASAGTYTYYFVVRAAVGAAFGYGKGMSAIFVPN